MANSLLGLTADIINIYKILPENMPGQFIVGSLVLAVEIVNKYDYDFKVLWEFESG